MAPKIWRAAFVTSMAISLATFRQPRFLTAARFARQICQEFPTLGLPPRIVLNVNIPNRPLGRIRGVRATRQSRSRWLESFDQRKDPRGTAYYWLKGGPRQVDPDPQSDEWAVRRGWVSVTPLNIDLTSHQHLDALATRWPR